MVRKKQIPGTRILRRARSMSASLARGRSATKSTGKKAVSNESNRASRIPRGRILKPQAERATAPIWRPRGTRARCGALGRERWDRWKPSNVHNTLGLLAEVSPSTLDQISKALQVEGRRHEGETVEESFSGIEDDNDVENVRGSTRILRGRVSQRLRRSMGK